MYAALSVGDGTRGAKTVLVGGWWVWVGGWAGFPMPHCSRDTKAVPNDLPPKNGIVFSPRKEASSAVYPKKKVAYTRAQFRSPICSRP